ncbi:thiopeptide-type bacteriocin biosynthesis protein [Kitasatospora sp. NPDC092286]|uniref:thiopeptide-type bacteriocin biosynthesis protein n=1 Tax=Kitasatospora sp. NPDC092286 TaxID=3364087 RepID=UPI0038196021
MPSRPDAIEKAVLAVLTGTPLADAAARVGVAAPTLGSAAETYRTAGRAAIDNPADTWVHFFVQPASWDTAENAFATQLFPYLRDAETSGDILSWWYVRKHPVWRLRFQPGPATTATRLRTSLTGTLTALQQQGVITTWSHGIYEPETAALGGPRGMDAAHRLFHTDSRAILREALSRHHATGPVIPVRRPELSILLCSAMLRAAGQEWTEQGDVWDRVAQMRQLPTCTTPESITSTTSSIGRLMAADTVAMTAPGQALELLEERTAAFTQTGHDLAEAARTGELTRGLRAMLALMVIFHWNRAAIPTHVQAVLARAARDHILGPPLGTPC